MLDIVGKGLFYSTASTSAAAATGVNGNETLNNIENEYLTNSNDNNIPDVRIKFNFAFFI